MTTRAACAPTPRKYFDPKPLMDYARRSIPAAEVHDSQLAALLGFDRSTINRWGNGQRRLTLENAEDAADAMGMHPLEIWPDLYDHLPPEPVPVPVDPDQPLGVSGLAGHYGMARFTITNWVSSEDFPSPDASNIAGRRRLWRPSTVDVWIETQRAHRHPSVGVPKPRALKAVAA